MQPVPDGDRSRIRIPPALAGALAICVLFTIAVGFYPQLVGRVGDMASFYALGGTCWRVGLRRRSCGAGRFGCRMCCSGGCGAQHTSVTSDASWGAVYDVYSG